jgi:hypothetical protein
MAGCTLGRGGTALSGAGGQAGAPGGSGGEAGSLPGSAGSGAAGGEIVSTGGMGGDPTGAGGTGGLACGEVPTPPGGPCPRICSNCGPDGKTCFIECGRQQCIGTVIDCPPGFSCHVSCNGFEACDEAILSCPPIYGCVVSCSNDDESCESLDLHCGSASACALHCGLHEEACIAGAFVECGEGACCTDGIQPAQLQGQCQSACYCGAC